MASWFATDPPPGVWETGECLHTEGRVRSLAWSPDGVTLAAGETSGRVSLWAPGGTPHAFNPFSGREDFQIHSVAWSPDGSELALGGSGGVLTVVDTAGSVLRTKKLGAIKSLAWDHARGPIFVSISEAGGQLVLVDPETLQHSAFDGVAGVAVVTRASLSGQFVATGTDVNESPEGHRGAVKLWDVEARELSATLLGHSGYISDLSWSSGDREVVTVGLDSTIRVWDVERRSETAVLEHHTSESRAIDHSPDGRLFASRGWDSRLVLWRSSDRTPVAEARAEPSDKILYTPVRFNPRTNLIAVTGRGDTGVHILGYDPEVVLGQSVGDRAVHATAKIVLLGESGVGKTGLGWRLAKGEFREQSSTHGQQFWRLEDLQYARADGVFCDAVLWDLAGQPDYRIIHSLFVDDADLALVLFDPTDPTDPLAQTEYWLKTFTRRLRADTPTVLVGARIDRGALTVTDREVAAHCDRWSVAGGYVGTSALAGTGIDDLRDRMLAAIRWDRIVATNTPLVFHAIKERVLALKESADDPHVLLTFPELSKALAGEVHPSPDEVGTAVDRLAKHGYVRILATQERPVVLLRPELVNNLAASLVLEARRNPQGLGTLVEERVIASDYPLPELHGLTSRDQGILLRAVVDLLLRHTICFAETTAVSTYLVFPELINVRRAPTTEENSVEDVTYRARGATENLYASLVVLLGYTGLFIRVEHWHRNAEYSYRDGGVCGFRLADTRGGELDFVLYASPDTDATALNLFRSLFERILATKGVEYSRYPRLRCGRCREPQERAVVIRRIDNGESQTFCANCGDPIPLTLAVEHLAAVPLADTSALQKQALRRARFEQALAVIRSSTGGRPAPSCFISYAWDDAPTTEWVRERLAPDLRHAGITVILDRWWTEFGDNVARWIEDQLPTADYVIPVCTPRYRAKYDAGSVVGAEVDLINARLTGPETKKRTVVPVLRQGRPDESIPTLMAQRLWAPLHDDEQYLPVLLELALGLHGIKRTETPFAEHLAALAP